MSGENDDSPPTHSPRNHQPADAELLDVPRGRVAEPSRHATVLKFSAEANEKWFDFPTWYRIHPDDVATLAEVRTLLRRAARYGVHAVSVPAEIRSQEPDYMVAISSEARRLGVRLLVDISTRQNRALQRTQPLPFPEMAELIRSWFAHGATGIELGIEILEPVHPTHIHAGYKMDDLTDLIDSFECDAVTSIGLRGHDVGVLREHINDKKIQVIRSDAFATTMTFDTAPVMLSKVYAATGMRNSVPIWPLTHHTLNLIAGVLSPEAVALVLLALPGLVHFEHTILTDYPFLRHALRLRESYKLMRQKVAITTNPILRTISIYAGEIEVRINFNDSQELSVESDEEVLIHSSTEASHTIPPYSLAWIGHHSSTK